ncbi:hypothetical protein HPB49_026395 [Dermacentor silvarum]|nr:hypothetical protein HPB49_026395 [Dermacentor silvarum]
MADATTVTGYDPTSLRVVTMETTSSDQAMPSEHEYLADMVKLWQRKQSQAAAPPKGQGSRAATLPQVAASGSSTRRSPDGTRTAPPSPPRRQPKWRPRHTPRLSRDDYIVVLKPRAPFELKSVLPSDLSPRYLWRSAYLGTSSCRWETSSSLFGAMPRRPGISAGVITINPAETPQRIKSELEWSQGSILAVRKLGDSTAAVVTFEGTKLPRFIFYHSVVAYVRPYKKTIPACSLCGTIGHRPSACPRPTPGRCTRCGTQVQVTSEGLAEHECNPTCLLCSGPHETRSGVQGNIGNLHHHRPRSHLQPRHRARERLPNPSLDHVSRPRRTHRRPPQCTTAACRGATSGGSGLGSHPVPHQIISLALGLHEQQLAPRRRKVAGSSSPAINPASIPLPAPQGQGQGMEDDP